MNQETFELYVSTWSDVVWATPTARHLPTINVRLGRKLRFLSNATSADEFVMYCYWNDEAVITRWLRLYFKAELTSRLCHTAPFMELKFRLLVV